MEEGLSVLLSVVTSTGAQNTKVHLNVDIGHFCQVAWFTAEKTVLFDFKCIKSTFVSGNIINLSATSLFFFC